MERPLAEGGPSPAGDARIVTRGRRIEAPSVRSLLTTDERPRAAWFTASELIAVRGATLSITASGATRFESIREQAETVFERITVPDSLPNDARPRLFGGFSFYDGTQPPDSPWGGFPTGWFFLPQIQLAETDGGWWLTATATGIDAAEKAERMIRSWASRLDGAVESPLTRPPGVTDRQQTPSRSGWQAQVEAALECVARDELEKVVLAQSLSLTLASELVEPDVLTRLGRTYPDCYRFLLSPPTGGTFFGATPERLVERRGRTVRTEALAGSTGRGDTPAEDEWLAAELLESEKDRHEHDLVVDAISQQLEPLTASMSTGPRSVRRLATVQHLETPISGELETDNHVLSLVDALHPTPAVGGLPPDVALETITESEQFDRGWYAAPVGWFDAAGNGTFAVAIRSALSTGDRATLFAGAGIVADSDPDREWDEVQLKYRPMLDELE